MMLRRASSLLIAVVLLLSLCALGQQRNRGDQPPRPAPAATPADQSAKPAAPAAGEAKEAKKEPAEQPPVVTHHEIHVGGTRLQMGLGAKGGREVPGACTSSRYYNY